MTLKTTFDILLLIARPAAGKSEIIHYLKNTPQAERSVRFHIGNLVEIDDFPMLWTWLEEDRLLDKMGRPHLYTDQYGIFLHQYLWDLLIERIGLEYQKKLRDIPHYEESTTTLVEFSRGKEHGGYRSAFSHLAPQMLQKMAVLYIDVSYEESLRKNRKRFNPNRPDSILEHGIADRTMELLYKEVDWEELSRGDPGYLDIQGLRVPYAVFENEDDVTTQRGAALGRRLEETLDRLWELYRENASLPSNR